ncbi:MAG: hypothetical protein QM820_19760 [Minicystis sp.]
MKRYWLMAWALAFAAGCSDGTGPGPGDTPPGETCTKANECGCWECLCEGIGGDPGAAQLCKPDGYCPSGDEACTTVCSLAGAPVAKATAVDKCAGVP